MHGINEVEFLFRDKILTARLLGEIDHHKARRIREEIDGRIFLTHPGLLVLDFTHVTFMDSSGIGLIMGRCDCMDAIGGRVFLDGLSDGIRRLVRISGIDKIRNVTVPR